MGLFSKHSYPDTFIFGEKKLPYNRVPINNHSERSIEVPIGLNFLQQHKSKRVLEIGNVLQQYIGDNIYGKRHILDKFEISPGILNIDLMEYTPSEKYDAIISISTVEHIGQLEDPTGQYGEKNIHRDKEAPLKAIIKIYNLLAKGGQALITVPFGKLIDLGWLIHFDDNYMHLLSGKYGIPDEELLIKYYKKIDMEVTLNNPRQIWIPCSKEDIVNTIYDSPFPNANGIAIIEINKIDDRELPIISKSEESRLKFQPPNIINSLYFNVFNPFHIPSKCTIDGWIPIRKNGVVFYGPYIKLNSGWHILDLDLEVNKQIEFTIDIVANMGTKVIMTHNANNSLLFSYKFYLPTAEDKVEIRLFNNTAPSHVTKILPLVRVKKLTLSELQ